MRSACWIVVAAGISAACSGTSSTGALGDGYMNEDDGTGEVRVKQRRPSDEELASKGLHAHPRLVGRFDVLVRVPADFQLKALVALAFVTGDI